MKRIPGEISRKVVTDSDGNFHTFITCKPIPADKLPIHNPSGIPSPIPPKAVQP